MLSKNLPRLPRWQVANYICLQCRQSLLRRTGISQPAILYRCASTFARRNYPKTATHDTRRDKRQFDDADDSVNRPRWLQDASRKGDVQMAASDAFRRSSDGDSSAREPLFLKLPSTARQHGENDENSNTRGRFTASDYYDYVSNFEATQLRPVIIKALRKAYPNIKAPTAIQLDLLQNLAKGSSICCRGEAGSGKSFALALWLLSLTRATRLQETITETKVPSKYIAKESSGVMAPEVDETNAKKVLDEFLDGIGAPKEKPLTTARPEPDFKTIKVKKNVKIPTTTAILLVPNPDLCTQYAAQFTNLLNASAEDNGRPPPTASVFQVLFRSTPEDEMAQISTLIATPNPHIVICTPTRMLDILADPTTKALIDLKHLKTVAVDEADSVIPPLPRYPTTEELKKRKRRGNKAKAVQDKNAAAGGMSPGERLVDYIFALNQSQIALGKGWGSQESLLGSTNLNTKSIQLVFISATLNILLRNTATELRGWLQRSGYTGRPTASRQADPAQMIMLGPIGKPQEFNRFTRRIPRKIAHHFVAFDPATGVLRDAPLPALTEEECLSYTRTVTEVREADAIEKFKKDISNTGLDLEVAIENLRMDVAQEVDDDWSNRLDSDQPVRHSSEDIMARGYPPSMTVEILDALLKKDNYPTNVLLFVGPSSSRPNFVSALTDAGYNANELRWQTAVNHGLQLGRSDREANPSPRPLLFKGQNSAEQDVERTKSDTTIWITNTASSKGLDIPNIYHAYIFYPWTKTKDYIHMCALVARGHNVSGQVVSVVLEEHMIDGSSDVKPGYIPVDCPREAEAWERLCVSVRKLGCQLTPFFNKSAEFTKRRDVVDDVLAMLDEEEEVDTEEDAAKPEGFMDLNGIFAATDETVLNSAVEDEELIAETEEAIEEATRKDENDPLDSSEVYESTDIEGSSKSPLPDNSSTITDTLAVKEAANKEKVNNEIGSEQPDLSSDLPNITLEESPHFVPEDTDPSLIPPFPTSISSEAGSIAEVNADIAEAEDPAAELLRKPLELGEGVTEQDAEEFQKAQDDVFVSFLELNNLMDEVKKQSSIAGEEVKIDIVGVAERLSKGTRGDGEIEVDHSSIREEKEK